MTIRKTARYLLAILFIISLNFFIPRAMPGNPLLNILGEDVQLSKEQLAELENEFGLDLPVHLQFIRYLEKLTRLDLGYSYHYHRPVSELIASRLRWTLLLALPSILIGAVTGAIAGALAGFRPSGIGGRFLTAGALALHSAPPYFLAIILLYLFSYNLGWFPLKGYYTTGTVLDIAAHLVLPMTVLSLFSAARNLMVMRGSVIQERTRH